VPSAELRLSLADCPGALWAVALAIADQLREMAGEEEPRVAARLRELAARVDSGAGAAVDRGEF